MKHVKKPLLMIVAVVITLCMIRLGVWQLDRAEQKGAIVEQANLFAKREPIELAKIKNKVIANAKQLRFRSINAQGNYLPDKAILIDNQVLDTKVGYWLLIPFKVSQADNSEFVVMVNQGWVPVGENRSVMPKYQISENELTIQGHLNMPPAKPPLWNDKYLINKGQIWQFLPIEYYQQQSGLQVLPLVIELARESKPALTALNSVNNDLSAPLPIKQFKRMGDDWAVKHRAYALQWFSMAVVFFLACLVVLVKSNRKQ